MALPLYTTANHPHAALLANQVRRPHYDRHGMYIAFYMRLFSNFTNSQCYTIVNVQMPGEFYFERTIVVKNFPR